MNDVTVESIVGEGWRGYIGEKAVPTSAVLIVEFIYEDGNQGISYVRDEATPMWKALGMLRATQVAWEADLVAADDTEDDE